MSDAPVSTRLTDRVPTFAIQYPSSTGASLLAKLGSDGSSFEHARKIQVFDFRGGLGELERHLLADNRSDLGSEKLDRAHHLLVRHRPDGELDQEALVA